MAKSDVKSIMSISSRTEGSTTVLSRVRSRNVPLHERCSMSEMVKIKEAFQAAYRNKLLPTEFRNVLRTLLNVEYDDEEYNILFMKINTSRTGEIDWDELVSHLILGYFSNDPDNQRASLQQPIMGLPTVMRSQHRHPISRICFCPDVDKNRCTDPMQGNYIAASRDGMISWWSLDMTLLRSAYSSSPHLKVRTTWVTDAVCLPDVNIVVTSSTERDLRFYDSTAKTFTLKLIITSWEYMICTMYYHFSRDINEKCKLICGDVGGNIRILLFSAIKRGPFRNQPGCALQQLRHVDLQKRPHLLPEMKLVELRGVHGDWVRQVSYYASLHCVVSCATSAEALLMTDFTGSKTHNVFRVDKGIQCFAFDEEAHVLATGGPDCIVRVWNPFVPSKASVVFPGHHAGVVALVLQNSGQTVYSLSRDRVVKVWDVQGQSCMQTYIDIPPQIGERTPISAVYNPATRELILAAIKIAIIVLDEELNPQHTDGFTHSRAVSKVLYNPLFKVIITCGMDSIIINWDPITGKRNAMVRDAHTRLLHGELIPVEITAACFDPGYQLLLTGARNGTLKVWNFNTGVCLRNMSIEHMCEVTNCFWVEGRILAVGWNRHVTEFEEGGAGSSPGDAGGEGGKSWETRHSEDVMAAAARVPFTLATASYNSELIFWKMETGQPYRRFSCTEPWLRIKMQYSKRAPSPQSSPAAARRSTSAVPRASVTGVREAPIDSASAMQKARARRASAVTVEAVSGADRPLAVHAMIFLTTRPCHMRVASLMASLEDGQIQAWSEHPAGGLQGSFRGVHTQGDYVSAFATDQDNDYLFTGTTVGYIKVWLMTNYLTNKEAHVSMPRLRTAFPFLWRQRVSGRALRAALRNAPPRPLLLCSVRAHMRCVTTLAYVDRMGLLLSGSSDYSVRAWRLSGEYVGTLGSFLPWNLDATRFPADVKKVASSTTLRVWSGGSLPRDARRGSQAAEEGREAREAREAGAPELPEAATTGLPLPPRRPEPQAPPVLDDSLQTIPLYAHLRLSSTQPVRRARTPELVRALRLRHAPAGHTRARRGPRTHFEGRRPEEQPDDSC